MTPAIRIENSVRKKVGSARSARAVSTGMLRKIDSPRSPRASWPRKSTYCTASGRSSPSRARNAAMSCCVASGPSMTAAGSPGATRTMTNTIVTTTNITAIMPSEALQDVAAHARSSRVAEADGRAQRRAPRCAAPAWFTCLIDTFQKYGHGAGATPSSFGDCADEGVEVADLDGSASRRRSPSARSAQSATRLAGSVSELKASTACLARRRRPPAGRAFRRGGRSAPARAGTGCG